jgi:hypothetical protein
MGHMNRESPRTLSQAWESFAETVCLDVPEEAAELARVCFWSGATALQGVLTAAADGDAAEWIANIEAVIKELDSFKTEIRVEASLGRTT